jgi:hypothetical protein
MGNYLSIITGATSNWNEARTATVHNDSNATACLKNCQDSIDGLLI